MNAVNPSRDATFEVSTNTRSSVNTGLRLAITGRNQLGVRPKAMMNVSRYSASGITHNSGTDAMSVVMWKVTPSIRLDGTNASPSQRSFRRVGGAVGSATAGSPGGAAGAG